MIRICIGGRTGSGKTTLGGLIAKELNIEHITKTQTRTYNSMLKDIKEGKVAGAAARSGLSSHKYIRAFDREIASLARGKNCVVTTWLGPWVIKDATLRIWLNASLDERARRISRAAGISLEEAKAKVSGKDRVAARDFKNEYGIDINDHAAFDAELNTEKLSNKEAVAVISMLAMLKDKETNKW